MADMSISANTVCRNQITTTRAMTEKLYAKEIGVVLPNRSQTISQQALKTVVNTGTMSEIPPMDIWQSVSYTTKQTKHGTAVYVWVWKTMVAKLKYNLYTA